MFFFCRASYLEFSLACLFPLGSTRAFHAASRAAGTSSSSIALIAGHLFTWRATVPSRPFPQSLLNRAQQTWLCFPTSSATLGRDVRSKITVATRKIWLSLRVPCFFGGTFSAKANTAADAARLCSSCALRRRRPWAPRSQQVESAGTLPALLGSARIAEETHSLDRRWGQSHSQTH